MQETNISDALAVSQSELRNSIDSSSAVKIIVLLTDGVATRPEKTGDSKFPEVAASEVATSAKKDNIRIFTIGLGKDVNSEFLKLIATNASDYYAAPTTAELSQIYESIATKICERKPASIEIIHRVYPPNIIPKP